MRAGVAVVLLVAACDFSNVHNGPACAAFERQWPAVATAYAEYHRHATTPVGVANALKSVQLQTDQDAVNAGGAVSDALITLTGALGRARIQITAVQADPDAVARSEDLTARGAAVLAACRAIGH